MKEACHCCRGSGVEVDDVKIGRELRAMRLAAKVSQKSMALELGISPSMLVFLEQGRRRWTQQMISKFKAVLLFAP